MPEFSTDQRKKLAQKQQAMPDGGYPIRNVSDLKNAIQAYGRATNNRQLRPGLRKGQKLLDEEDLLPDNWRTTSVSHGFKEVNMWNYNYSYPPYLCHHGIKGQKWGFVDSRMKMDLLRHEEKLVNGMGPIRLLDRKVRVKSLKLLLIGR